ncbi:WG repeat-containing protein, partial [Acidobacteriota bacterium]
ARSYKNGKIGYIDKTGKFIIPPRYDLGFIFREGRAAVSISGQYGFIDKTGKEVIALDYNFAEVFIGGLAKVMKGEQWMYIDLNGNTIWPRKEIADKKLVQNNLSIRYSMSGIREVSIQKGHLTYSDSEYKGKDPRAAGNPDDYVRMGSEVPVSAAEIESLMKVIQTSGFLDLKDTYGTSQDDRHYPVRITIESSTINKSVLYRSHPCYPVPAAFQKVEEAILNFAKSKIH